MCIRNIYYYYTIIMLFISFNIIVNIYHKYVKLNTHNLVYIAIKCRQMNDFFFNFGKLPKLIKSGNCYKQGL